MKYFVTADIHGFYDEFMEALNEKGFDFLNSEHKIIICGDLFDRGRQPKQIIDFILKHKKQIILIRGNHEDLMQKMIDRNSTMVYDLTNGTANTIVDLCPEWHINKFNLEKIAKETRLKEILDLCIDYFETKNYIFVHGWIPTTEELQYNKNWRNAQKEDWDKSRWSNPVEMFKNRILEPDKTIVCGHWHCSALWHEQYPTKYDEFGPNENFEPFITKELIALDACTVYSHKVNVIVLED